MLRTAYSFPFGNPAVWRYQTLGFASPPHDGFAFFESSIIVTPNDTLLMYYFIIIDILLLLIVFNCFSI